MTRLLVRVINKIWYYIFRVFNYFILLNKRYPKVINSHNSIKQIIDKRLSVCRFGDGEMNMIRGAGWGFQSYDPELAYRLQKVLESNENDIAICIPDVFKDKSRFTDIAKMFWHNYLLNNLFYWNKYTLKNKSYLDSLFTRFYMDLEDKNNFPAQSLVLLKMIWDNDDLLIVEGAGSRLGYKNDLFDNAKSIKRILCPAENASFKYNLILELSEKHAGDKLVLIALGMTATVLSFDLAKKGYRAIDIGHIDIEYEWYRMKALSKVPVKHRYMNEVSCREVDSIKDEEYLSQILAEIK
jgi:glycosyltransferase family protein